MGTTSSASTDRLAQEHEDTTVCLHVSKVLATRLLQSQETLATRADFYSPIKAVLLLTRSPEHWQGKLKDCLNAVFLIHCKRTDVHIPDPQGAVLTLSL